MRHKHPSSKDILSFEAKNGLKIPTDLKEYFLTTNLTDNSYNEHFYWFYKFDRFESIDKGLRFWYGSPSFSNVLYRLKDYKDCFVFADYMFHMFVYAIRLYQEDSVKNEVYVFSGDQYKLIAQSFSGFMQLYEEQSVELHFGE